MSKNELLRIMEEIADAFPRFNCSEGAVRIWFEHLGGFSAKNVRQAVKRHIANSSHAPTIADIRQTVQAIFGKSQQIGVGEWLPSYKKIDFCMDMLGPKFVSDELKLLAGGDDLSTALSLTKQSGWVEKYKAKLAEMLTYSRQLWDEGKRPEYKWAGGDTQRVWAHHEIPIFDDDQMYMAKRKSEMRF